MSTRRFLIVFVVFLVLVSSVVLPMGLVQARVVQSNLSGQEVSTFPSITLTADAVIRPWPSNSMEAIGTLPKRSTVPVSGRTGDGQWWQIPFPLAPAGYGWIHSSVCIPNDEAYSVPVYSILFEDSPPPTPTVTPTPTPIPCTYNSAYVADVTIPDGTVVGPGQSFYKIWRIKNTGTCHWGTDVQLALVGGFGMGAPVSVPALATASGGTADIGVSAFAPSQPGRYENVWQLKDPFGQPFGARITIVIDVPGWGPSPPPPPPPPAPPPPPSDLEPYIHFWTDTTRVNWGECTNIHWDVENVQAIFLEHGDRTRGVVGHDSKWVCPHEDGKTYTLHVVRRDGSEESRKVKIDISGGPPSGGSEAEIELWVERKTIFRGECTMVSWNVRNARDVEYTDSSDWRDVGHSSTIQVCPQVNTTYRIKAVGLNDKTKERGVEIKVASLR